ncbi:MAG: porin [Deltaproteobacteria bacterium]|jgi:hypothetical protein|nr:porin [Deltaproteobacteria bacterium]
MKTSNFYLGFLAFVVVLALSLPVSAAVTLYDTDGMSVTTDAFFNTFYVYSSSDKDEELGEDRDQSRVKMGFLPNYIGFNFSKQLDNMKVGGRSSFWVTINDSEENVTSTGIDVRQFYGTVEGDWGQFLVGKDFTLFCRSNIFLDEILMGYGNVSDTLGLIDGTGVSFGNIGTGYVYPFPNAQITYRTPTMAGFKLALGVIDPAHTADNFNTAVVPEENAPQVQGELTYNYSFDSGTVTAWTGFLWQSSEDAGDEGDDLDSEGVSYGVQVKVANFAVHASGFSGSGLGFLLGPGVDNTLGLPLVDADGDELDSSGYLFQGSYTYGPGRFVLSYGENKLETDPDDWKNKTTTVGYFHTLNDHVKLVAEYNVNKITVGTVAGEPEEETDTIALGAIISF